MKTLEQQIAELRETKGYILPTEALQQQNQELQGKLEEAKNALKEISALTKHSPKIQDYVMQRLVRLNKINKGSDESN